MHIKGMQKSLGSWKNLEFDNLDKKKRNFKLRLHVE